METPAFYKNMAERRASATVRPKPADPKRGHHVRCYKCKGTGDAGFNHMNGDEYCYPCTGSGWRLVFTADEQAQIDAERAWFAEAHRKGYDLRLKVERIARKGAEERMGYKYHCDPETRVNNFDDPRVAAARASARRTGRLATFWVREGLEMMSEGGTV